MKHFALRQSAVSIELNMASKKKAGYQFTLANYFRTPNGYIYVFRNGVPYPQLFCFTGHFFDRVLERNIGSDDHAARMTVVFRLLRQLDAKLSSENDVILTSADNSRCFMSAFGGLCLGSYNLYSSIGEAANFETDTFYSSDSTGKCRINVRFLF